MNKLVEEIIKPILEANSNIKKIVGIYGGRFQPFGPHHYKTYKWLTKQVDEAYISTSNIKKPPRHPMNFKEKVRHMSKMGVPSSKIIEEKTPYVAKNLQKKFNKDTTAFVYVFGAKDAGRLGGSGKYYKDYKKNKNDLVGYEEHGYYLVAPHVSISVGGKEVSGTTMRELLGSDKYDDKERAKLFKKMFGYYDKGVFQMMTNKFKKLFEQDIMHTTWDNTDEKPKNPKLFDKKKRDLLFDMTVDKLIKKLKIPQKLMKGNRQKIINYITSNPQIVTQMIRLATEETLKEVKLPIKVGDTVRMGKFKNKKVVVKSIDWNEKGDLLINGRPALKFRIEKKGEVEEGYPNEEDMKKIRKRVKKARSKSDSSKEYQYHPIDEFLINFDIKKIFESSNTGTDGIQGVDSGPSLMFKNADHYKGRGDKEAEKLGWTVINYILKGDTDNLPPSEFELLDGWPLGPHNSVSYLPAGIGTGKTPNNQENLTGTKGYDKWLRSMKTKAEEVGYQLMKFTKQDRDIRAQIAKDTVDTIKQQEKEEVEESTFSKYWWKSLLSEEDVMDKTIKYKDKKGNEKEATVGGILKQGEDHPGYKKAKSMTDKDDDKKEPVKKTKIDANPFDKEKPKEKPKSKKELKQHKTEKGSQLVGVKHGQSVEQIIDGIKKDIKPDEKVTFVAEGGWIEDGKVKGLEGEQKEIVQGLLDHFGDNLEITSMEEGADVYDNNSPVYKHIEKQGNLSQEQSMAAIWSNMVGQDKEESDMSAEDYLSEEGVDWLKGEAEKANMKFSDDFPNKISKEDYDILYKLNYGPEDKDGTAETEVSRAQEHYNEFRQKTVVDKINKSESDGRKAVVTPGESHVEPIQKLLDKSTNESITEVSAKTKKFKQKLMRRGIVIRYDKAKAQKDLEQKYGGQGEVVGKKFGLRKAYYAVPKKGFKKDTKPTITINKKEMDKLHTDKKIEKGNLRVLYKENIVTKDLLKPRGKELLLMGGAYGHMAHPFDDKDLTFGDLKKIIELGLGGQLNREDNVTEKLDGQNIMVSFKDGKLIAARNKGHIKNGGKTALDKKGIASKFKGRGAIRNAFVYAMNDLEKAIKSLSDKQRDKIFNNGYNFMNLEVMYPSSANVIDYDVTELIFHGALKYDDKGNVIGEVPGSGRMLQGMIQQRNQNIQKKYSIGKPVFLDIPKHQDFGKLKSKFLSTLTRYQNKFNLKDNDTLGLYHQKWWESFITKKSKGTITGDTLKGLVKRWAFFDKKYSVKNMKNDIKDEKMLEWALSFDKENHAKQVKENMRPFEILFFEVGAEILKNVKGFITANPKKSVRNMIKNLDKAIKVVQSGGDVKKLSRLKTQLDRLNAIGGTKAIVPSEGLVFKYKGKTYKFTGAFAPVNQITGLIYF